MKVMLVNKFLYPKGGDAISTLTTGKLLESKGHEVILWGMQHPINPECPCKEYFVSYMDFNKHMNLLQKLRAALRIFYSFEAKTKMEEVIKTEKPDIVHLNNFAHQISPSILDIFKKYKIPTVMTMRDYKLVCPTYTMLLAERPCEKCRNGRYYECLFNKCTKNSYTKSFLNTIEMYLHHKILHIYDQIDLIIATSQFLKQKVKEMGLKGEIVFLPNFISVDEFEPFYEWREKSLAYFGRLSSEKGLFALLEAIKGLDIRLKIFGDGPLKKDLEEKVYKEEIQNVCLLSHKSQDELKNEVKNSMFVVFPSECYETFGRTVIESFALGKPVIGSRIGGIPELVKDGETGLTFNPGNVEELRLKIEYLMKNERKIVEMGKNARIFVEKNYNEDKHYEKLMEIYQMAIERKKAS